MLSAASYSPARRWCPAPSSSKGSSASVWVRPVVETSLREPTAACSRETGLAPLGRLGRWCRSAVADPVLSVLFPPRCVGCGDFETYLCPACRASLRPAGDSCARCGEPGVQALVAGRCSACMGKEFEYAGARSGYLHEGAAKRLVAEFKFGGQPVLGSLMADLARPEFMRYVSSLTPGSPSLVTWVAAHRKAQRERARTGCGSSGSAGPGGLGGVRGATRRTPARPADRNMKDSLRNAGTFAHLERCRRDHGVRWL